MQSVRITWDGARDFVKRMGLRPYVNGPYVNAHLQAITLRHNILIRG